MEDGQVLPTAGLILLQALRELGIAKLAIVYTSQRSAARYNQEALQQGAVGATASATELFEILGVNFGPRFGLKHRAEVLRVLNQMGWDVSENAGRAGLDFIARRNDRAIGIEAKAWLPSIDTRAVDNAVARLTDLVTRGDIDEAWIVSAGPLGSEHPLQRGSVRLLTIEDLRTMEL